LTAKTLLDISLDNDFSKRNTCFFAFLLKLKESFGIGGNAVGYLAGLFGKRLRFFTFSDRVLFILILKLI